MNTLLLLGASLLGIYLFLIYSPSLLDYEPAEYHVPLPHSFDGPLEVNYKLSEAERLFQGILRGPESIVFYKGDLYTGLEDGRIVKIKDGKVISVAQTGRFCEMPYEEHQCGRPLGLRLGKDGLLYITDAYYGIFTMNFTTGILTRILSSSALIGGEKINFPDDIDLDDEGNIYITDASKKWDLSTIYYMMVEHESGGRILRYNIFTKQSEVLLSNLYFPNGIQLSKDKQSLLFNELLKRRIMRYYLKGSKKGKLEVFADNLPAEPDNIRASPRGYWVAFTSARNESNRYFVDVLSSYPQVRKVWGKIQHGIGTILWSMAEISGQPVFKTFAYRFKRGDIMLSLFPRHGLVMEFDERGKILRSLHSPDGKISDLSEATEHEGFLYLGSFVNNYLGRLKL